MLAPQDFFDLKDCEYQEIFPNDDAVWVPLDRLKDYLAAFFQKSWPLANLTGLIDKPLVIYQNEVRDDLEVKTTNAKGSFHAYLKGEKLEGASVILPGVYLFDDRIIIGSGTIVEPGTLIKGPVVIGDNCEVRQGAYFRGDCLIGNSCVVGHTTEIKGSIMLNGSKAGHFAYIGDSILGNDVNLGAGTKLANLKMIPGSVMIKKDRKHYNTNRRKLGAIIGDRTETGCNSVTSPGTLIGPRSIVYPGVSVPGGYYPERTIFMPSSSSLNIRTR
jgi:acetyltransferase-like isoleucine patch superfamily enzyme